ncbi:MAG TPA: DEAD/DEAH box helicase [Candidatus Limnocylindrales bacterium]
MRHIEVVEVGNGNRLAARFPYDPELIGIVRQVSGREWDKKLTAWTFPGTPENVLDLMRRCPSDVDVAMTRELRDKLNVRYRAIRDAAAIRAAGDATVEWPLRTTPYAHQRAGLAFLAKLGSGALFWEMGLGKTAGAIAYVETLAQADPELRVLVICPNTVKRNWLAEIEKHTGTIMGGILEGTLAGRSAQVKRGLSHLGRYTIVNCEALSLAPLNAALVDAGWDVVIVDESSRFKAPGASRTKALLRLAKRTPVRLILTGTPITGKPEDAWAQMEFVAPGMFGTWWSFLDRYLVRNPYTKAIEGVRPGMSDDLAGRVASRSYRIRKDDVLDLPPKVFEDRVVELDGTQAAAYASMKRDLRVAYEGGEIEAWNVLTQLLRLTQITAGLIGEGERYQWLATGNAKLAALDELLNEDLAGEQVVVYGVYQRELEELSDRYDGPPKGYIVGERRPLRPIIYGPTPERVRADLISAFQAGDRRLLFVQTHTGGIGINLTAAKTAIYYTRGWSLEDWLQSQDRLHRIGQRGTVTIVSLVAKGTVDEQIAKALAAKQNVADMLTGDALRQLTATVLER